MAEKAVLDRIVDGAHAVLLVGEAEQETIVPVALLPDGARPGAWLQVTRGASGEIVRLTHDVDETAAMRQRIADKLAKLRQRGCGGPP